MGERIKIIDTPGVNSINDTHTDITYGYLPFVDAAFVLMNINMGTTPASLLEFLKQYPKETLSKIYFVLNFADTKPAEAIINLKQSFKKNLEKIVENPRIFIISAKKALEAREKNDLEKFAESGVEEIENIIKNEIPEIKNKVAEKRIYIMLKNETRNLESLLESLLNSIDWNNPSLDSAIKEKQKEIKNIENEIDQLKKEFQKIKITVIEKINDRVKNYIEIISGKVSRKEDINDTINNMQEEIQHIIENGVSRLEKIEISFINTTFGEIIKNTLIQGGNQIKAIADLLNDIATFALTAWLVPGTKEGLDVAEGAAATGTIAIEKTTSAAAKSEKFLKFIGFLGKIVNEINPISKVEKIILPYILNPNLKKEVTPKITKNLEYIFNEIQFKMDEYIKENYFRKINDEQEILKNLRTEREAEEYNIDKKRNDLEEDLKKIRGFINDKQ